MLVIIKWLIIFFVPAFHDFKLFDSGAFFNTEQMFTYQKYFLFMFFYVLLCPVQEFLVRGFIQTSMQALMDGHSGWGLVKVILLSNLVFASMHAHISFFFEISAFIPGLFWGWLYARQKTLVGVSVSHILIGVWAVFIVGFQNMI
jgi:membrane protease YdiL (CAAX protease family)